MCLIFHSIAFYKNLIYPEVATSAFRDFALENCSRRKYATDIFLSSSFCLFVCLFFNASTVKDTDYHNRHTAFPNSALSKCFTTV